MSIYVIGDIQGCYDEMRYLLDRVSFDPVKDQAWFVGDLINRGPKNLPTLRFVKSLGRRAVVVLGNHDLHFLAIYHGIRRPMRKDTFDDLLAASDCEELVDWLRHRPLIHHDSKRNYTLVHAGLAPQWSLKTAMSLAREVEKKLCGKHYVDFLAHMYGDEPDCWNDDLEGFDSLRVITNYFTRLRYCKSNGRMEFTHKENIVPKGYQPWFRHRRSKQRELRILFGHWAYLNGKTGVKDVFALDTGCVWGRRLTLMHLKTQKRTSVPSQ
jgi:bis(5'-nucleosyl)-tetraphosphatase (symmetrical)